MFAANPPSPDVMARISHSKQGSGQKAKNSSDESKTTDRLKLFFSHVNPEKISIASKLILKYHGNESLLNHALKEKYGLDLTASADEVVVD
eukprot:767937-Hanusia_phi.AAC.4